MFLLFIFSVSNLQSDNRNILSKSDFSINKYPYCIHILSKNHFNFFKLLLANKDFI